MKRCVAIFPQIQHAIIIDCVVGVPDYDDATLDRNSVICKALIDTGAMKTCISKRVADFLGMIPSGTMKVTVANGQTDVVNTHVINLTLGGDIRFSPLTVPRLDMMGQDIIIGMDLLSKGNTVISNSDQGTTFVFEVP